MPKSRHPHLYRRIKFKDHYMMKCQKLGCSHYQHMNSKFSIPILLNSLTECNRCHEPFILDKRALQMEKPCCIDCIKHKKETKEKVKSAEAFFEDLEKGLGEVKNAIDIE